MFSVDCLMYNTLLFNQHAAYCKYIGHINSCVSGCSHCAYWKQHVGWIDIKLFVRHSDLGYSFMLYSTDLVE